MRPIRLVICIVALALVGGSALASGGKNPEPKKDPKASQGKAKGKNKTGNKVQDKQLNENDKRQKDGRPG
jgi:hypothetical protein